MFQPGVRGQCLSPVGVGNVSAQNARAMSQPIYARAMFQPNMRGQCFSLICAGNVSAQYARAMFQPNRCFHDSDKHDLLLHSAKLQRLQNARNSILVDFGLLAPPTSTSSAAPPLRSLQSWWRRSIGEWKWLVLCSDGSSWLVLCSGASSWRLCYDV
jgi:hypothetical protein